ncbi:MAG: glycosyltransferase, partial [Rhodobacteraceae bacterium]|nr:glycosyltransferase [Paracoccaceae bacterium]
MSVLHVTHSLSGGAGIAAQRLCQAQRSNGIEARLVLDADLPNKRGLARLVQKEWSRSLRRRDPRTELLSLGLVDTGRFEALNSKAAAVLHLHWINNDMLSIRDVSAVRAPVVWTLHDMWPFSGACHYSENNDWKTGYANREIGDLDQHIWRRKSATWQTPMQIVAPSRWLAECARNSALMRDWPIDCIPNAINTDQWCPMPKSQARAALGLPAKGAIIAFGAMGGDSDPRKGFSALSGALSQLELQGHNVMALVFGSDQANAA